MENLTRPIRRVCSGDGRTKTKSESPDQKLWEECRRSVALQSAYLAPHQQSLIEQVVGAGGTPEGYIYGGLTTSIGLRAVLRLVGKSIHDFKRILDFGCGAGRVVRWFCDVCPPAELYGVDVNEEAIRWCQGNVAFAKFLRNPPLPPLPFPDGSLDLICGISVFTHLDEEYQLAWLREFERIAAPGAIVMLTVHGEDKASADLSPEEYAQFRDKGFLYRRAVEQGGIGGLPDFYQVAFHSWEYVEQTWSRFFEISAHVKHGPMYTQDLIVMNKAEHDSVKADRLDVDLPIACLETPQIGMQTTENRIVVTGWAFYPAGGKVELDLWIDGENAGSCEVGMPRPDVSKVFAYKTAEASGFRKAISIQELAKGPHLIAISEPRKPVPIGATFFVKS